VVACANGTDALKLALMALQIRPGDAVLVPTFTFVATVEPVALLGAVPIFLDIEPQSFTLDPSLVALGVAAARNAGHRPVGIIAVDLFGHPADYEALNSVAGEHDLWVVADAAQSFGASLNGRKVGTLAKITTTSFFPSKPLGCYGDGGAVMTDDLDIAMTLRSLRLHGRGEEKFESIRLGMNSRLDTFQAAVLLSKLEVFSKELTLRQQVASRFKRHLHGIVTPPLFRQGVVSAWASYTVRSDKRSALRKSLREEGIPTMVYYPQPIHKQAAYQEFPVANGSCPVADRAASEVLSIPMHPYLEDIVQKRIVSVMRLTISPTPGGEDDDIARK
jgi:dTDP-4-amino-4,6-dideoxygalactose transaminase